MNPIVISQQTARRFVLGKQGLWPGRRWKGKSGTAQALRACEAVQLDPLNVIARSQDIVLHSRVLDYKPEYLYKVMYKDREFFDYGGWLAVYPMADLPYQRVHMEGRSRDKRVEDFVLANPELFERVRAELRTRGPLGIRDLQGNAVGWNYRGRKDTSLALFDFDYKWEVYVPAHKRRWGYYTLPILYGNDLVARLDPKLDRTTMTLEIKGFWHEDDAPVKDLDFANALAKGLIRFAKFVRAEKVNIDVISPLGLRKQVQKKINEFFE